MQIRFMGKIATAGLMVVLSLSAKVILGQAVTGTLLGTVQDANGAVVPNASVTLTNQGTGVVDKTVTGPQGFYTFPALNPGQYTVTVTMSGFGTVVSPNNVVQVEQATRVDVTLHPGSVSERSLPDSRQ